MKTVSEYLFEYTTELSGKVEVKEGEECKSPFVVNQIMLETIGKYAALIEGSLITMNKEDNR